jgi:ankyrin repeat protein
MAEAILYGPLDCVKKLLEMGVDPNVVDELGRAPLHLAAQAGYREVVKLLLDYGADPNLRDGRGRTPLHYAVVRDNYIVMLLLESGANPDIADDSGTTPLHTAAHVGNYEAVKLFLNYRVSLELKDEYFGRTPLHWAAKGWHANIVWLLLLRGADPNARDNKGRTPLHLAVQTKPCVDVAKILLEAGGDPNIQDAYGRTPLHYAVFHDNPRIISLLLRYGADPNIKDNEGKTPLDLARSRGKMKAAEAVVKAKSRGQIRLVDKK